MFKKRNCLLFVALACLLATGCGGTDTEGEVSMGEEISEETVTASEPVAEDASNSVLIEETPEEIPAAEETGVTLPGADLNGDQYAAGDEPLRVTCADGFYYEPISDALKNYITGTSYPETADEDSLAISCEDLRYVHVLYWDFNGESTEGELICNVSIAEDLAEIFSELYENKYQVEQIHLVDEYEGDDDASMAANNTSCFNYRQVAGSDSLSKHALGRAVDINPLYNPYLTYNSDGNVNIAPADGAAYADRSEQFPHKIDSDDLCYQLFTDHGFTWGGSWNSVKDYQHFEK